MNPKETIVTPADLVSVPLQHLLKMWRRRLLDRPDGRRDDTLLVLALGEAVVETVRAGRWATAVDALTEGASVADVGTAMGLEVDEVVGEITLWAAVQYRHRLMDEERVLTLLADRDQVQWE